MKWYILETGKLDDNGLYYDKQIIGNNRIIAAMPYKSIDNYDTIADDRLFNDESDKYAALIAAAPELLEACKEAENYLKYNHGQGNTAYELCKKAIAKAEGK